MERKTPRDFITKITLCKPNIEHIASSLRFSGTLLIDLEKAFEDYAKSVKLDVTENALCKIKESILSHESEDWNGAEYENGYQQAIQDIHALILSLEQEIISKLKTT